MESKQPLQNAPSVKPNPGCPEKPANEISGRLADIELKLDHIIERLQDSLHRMNLEDWNREDSP